MRKRILNQRPLLTITLLTVLIDQLGKFLAKNHLSEQISKELIPHIIQLRLVRNTGAAFSLFSESTTLLGIISLSVSIGLIIYIWQNSPMQISQGLAISLLLGGSLGNGIDRWRLGYVIDFIEFIPINFPIFNVADIAINLSVIFFILDQMIKYNAKN